jgi:hypothetical protein
MVFHHCATEGLDCQGLEFGSQRIEKINEDNLLGSREITIPDNGDRDISLENATIVIFEEI